jgi:hypothetical protein
MDRCGLRIGGPDGTAWWKRLLWAVGSGLFGLANLLTSAAGLDSIAKFPGEGPAGPSWSRMSEAEFGTWIYVAIGLGFTGTAVGLVFIQGIVALGKARRRGSAG